MSSAGSFLTEIVAHLNAFATAAGVEADHVQVRLTFADGSAIHLRGLQLSTVLPTGGWGRIEGAGSTTTFAVIVREPHVLKAEFSLAPREHRPIGLHTEADRV